MCYLRGKKGKNYMQPRNFVNSEGVSDTIHKYPNYQMLEKGVIKKAEAAQEEFLSNLFLVR